MLTGGTMNEQLLEIIKIIFLTNIETIEIVKLSGNPLREQELF